MKAVFLSDAHLVKGSDRGYRKLLRFFREIREDTDHLVIAGDFFDFWFCDEWSLYPEFREMFDALVDVRRSGTAVSLIEGNHDFFLKEAFNGHDFSIFEDNAVLDLAGLKVYVSHGDTIDAANRLYLLFRRFLRSGLFFALQKRIPAALLWQVAGLSSRSSRKYQNRPDRIVSVMSRFARQKIEEGVDAVILGHSHRPLLETMDSASRRGTFALLGDWLEHYSYISFEDGHFSLEFYDGNE